MKAALLAAWLLAPAAAAPVLESVEGPGIVLDLRYATADNIAGRDLYGPLGVERCYALPELRRALLEAAARLAQAGRTLILWDCWRPPEAHQALWKAVPDKRAVADPKKGSSHSRGAAVDATLGDAKGQPLPMPTPFDAFGPRAAASYRCPAADAARCRNRDELATAMKGAGLLGYAAEWWHFSLPKASRRPLLDASPMP